MIVHSLARGSEYISDQDGVTGMSHQAALHPMTINWGEPDLSGNAQCLPGRASKRFGHHGSNLTIACPCNVHGVHGGEVVHPVEARPCLLVPASYEQVCVVWALV